MNFPQNIPNHFPRPDRQAENEKPKSVLREAAPQIILRIIVVALVMVITWIFIRELSGFGSSFGSTVMKWLNEAGINPGNRRSFENFLKLILTTGCIGLALYFFKSK